MPDAEDPKRRARGLARWAGFGWYILRPRNAASLAAFFEGMLLAMLVSGFVALLIGFD